MGNRDISCNKTDPIVLNFQGSKGNNVCIDDGSCFTIARMHGSDTHVVFFRKKIKHQTSHKRQ